MIQLILIRFSLCGNMVYASLLINPERGCSATNDAKSLLTSPGFVESWPHVQTRFGQAYFIHWPLRSNVRLCKGSTACYCVAAPYTKVYL